MIKQQNNYAFIDSQNVNLAIRDQGWILNFKRFRKYLKDKYRIRKVFLFIGYVAGNELLYANLQSAGYIVIFKPTLEFVKNRERRTKGNVDAELVLHAMIEYPNYDKAVLISGDGDFHCLVEYLKSQNKLLKIIIPNKNKYSSLLRKFMQDIVFMNNLKRKLAYKNRN